MKYLILYSTFVFLLCKHGKAQNYEKIIVNAKDSASGYYLAFKPQTSAISGVLVLLDGFGGAPETIPVESKLPNFAFANGILTVAAGMGQKVYADSTVSMKLNLILRDVIRRFKISPDKFVLGGFSAGGTIALRYAELCKEFPLRYPIEPKAVFAIDSPIDVIDLWAFFEKQIERNTSEIAVGEAKFVSALMLGEHGTPKSNPSGYDWLTPFNHHKKEAGNERFLQGIPVRVYHDVDIVWRLQNRMQSGYDANFLNSSEFILRLLILKNDKAEFVQGRTGYRSDGLRHPHSWNIVDEAECIQWIKGILAK